MTRSRKIVCQCGTSILIGSPPTKQKRSQIGYQNIIMMPDHLFCYDMQITRDVDCFIFPLQPAGYNMNVRRWIGFPGTG
jgi:hypothetical protein